MFDVITIGGATRDVFITSPLFKIVRDPKHLEKLGFPTGEAQCFALGGKIEVGKPVEAIGGGAANAAVTFARQGFKTTTFIKIGRDQNGECVLRDLRRDRVAPLAAFDRALGTGYSIILLSPAGERTILNYRGASRDVSRSDIPFDKLNARWAYISPGHIGEPIIRRILKTLKKRGARVAMNPSRAYIEMGARRLRPLLSSLDVIIMNREEAAYLTGISYRDERRIFKAFDTLVPGIAVMTDGASGALVSDGKTLYKAGTFREKKLIDRTGAGDAFGSGFVAELMRTSGPPFGKKHICSALRLAAANATSVVEHIGATAGILSRRALASPRFHALPVSTRAL